MKPLSPDLQLICYIMTGNAPDFKHIKSKDHDVSLLAVYSVISYVSDDELTWLRITDILIEILGEKEFENLIYPKLKNNSMTQFIRNNVTSIRKIDVHKLDSESQERHIERVIVLIKWIFDEFDQKSSYWMGDFLLSMVGLLLIILIYILLGFAHNLSLRLY